MGQDGVEVEAQVGDGDENAPDLVPAFRSLSGVRRHATAMSIDPVGVAFALAVVIIVEYWRRGRWPRRR